MDEMLKKQDVLDAIYATMEKTDKPDVILGLAAAMSTVKQMEAAPVNPAEKEEPCKDTISREAVIDIIEDVCPIYGNDYRYILRDKVNELPPVTAEKVGHWIEDVDSNPKIGNFHCSQCHGIGKSYYAYCPHCGREMQNHE